MGLQLLEVINRLRGWNVTQLNILAHYLAAYHAMHLVNLERTDAEKSRVVARNPSQPVKSLLDDADFEHWDSQEIKHLINKIAVISRSKTNK